MILFAGFRVGVVHFGDVLMASSRTLARHQQVDMWKRVPPSPISVVLPLLTSRVLLAPKALQVVRRQEHDIR